MFKWTKYRVVNADLCYFFLQFLVDIFPFRFGSVDSHFFANPDAGSQNLAAPTSGGRQAAMSYHYFPFRTT